MAVPRFTCTTTSGVPDTFSRRRSSVRSWLYEKLGRTAARATARAARDASNSAAAAPDRSSAYRLMICRTSAGVLIWS